MREIDVGSIDRSRYLNRSLSLTPKEISLRDYLMDYIPDDVIDSHAHGNLSIHVVELDQGILHHMMSTFLFFSIEESYALKAGFFPSKHIQTLRFPNAFRGIDHRAANDYLLNESPLTDRVGLYGVPTDIDYTLKMLKDSRVAALKMYPAFFSPSAQEVYDYFKPEVLEEVNALGLPIILHLPRMITECMDDLRRLTKDFPDLTIVLAHLGLPHMMVGGLREAYREVAKNPNVFMDTAMIPSQGVIEAAIGEFGSGRIMFGSDEPLGLIRAVVYQNPSLGQRLATEEDYHWVDKEEQREFSHFAKDAVHMHWSALLALKRAIDGLPDASRDRAADDIYYENARRVFGF